MNSVRYVVALIVVIGLPPGLVLWLFIHPFAGFWRKLGPVWTYVILGIPTVALMVGIFLARGSLMAVDFGTSLPLIALAVLALAGGMTIAVKRRKYLTAGILVGLPELSPKQYPGKLLNEGIYASIRHPRYVEAFLWVLGYALFANYLALYVVLVVCVPVIYIIVVLEERELRSRFGTTYEEYQRRVPRFLPGRRNQSLPSTG